MRVSDMLRENVELNVLGARVVYNQQRLTVADMEIIAGISEDDPDMFTRTIDLMPRILVEWDIEDEEGSIPITHEGLRRLPMEIARKILEAINEISEPSRAEGEDSRKGLDSPDSGSTRLPQETSLNGTQSSKQPDTSGSLLGNLPVSQSAG
jgi:hypothetical protein